MPTAAHAPSPGVPNVVVVGSGFGGLNAALRLARHPVHVTVVDRDNYHGFWPLLYQVATAGLSPDDIARPIRAVYAPHRNIDVRIGAVDGIDVERRCLTVGGAGTGGRAGSDGGDGKAGADGGDTSELAYDYLILAAGSSTTDFGIAGVAEHAYPLKSVPDAVRLRNHVLRAFEKADTRRQAGVQQKEMTVVLVGGGPTGVEMAGALSELIGHNLSSDFHDLDMSRARIVLVEMTDHLLPGFSPASQEEALSELLVKGVDVRLGTRLQKVTERGVTFEDGSEIESDTVVWTAGVRANRLADLLPGDKGKGGTVPVSADLSLPGHPEVFVIGDLAAATGRDGKQLPQLAQVAIQGGRRAADNVVLRMAGRPTKPFRYRNHGIMATIGRRSAVAELPGGIHFAGTVGWLAWLVVHLVFLIGFRNRVAVMWNWAWNYLTWDRASRVILAD